MTINEIVSMVRPPVSPIETPASNDNLPDCLDRQLPDDLLEFSRTFGGGSFGGRLTIYNPYSPNYSDIIQFVCETYKDIADFEGNSIFPYKLYPNTPGLYPWGSEDNGHEFFWYTEGLPNQWSVVLCAGDPRRFETYDMTMTSFLAKFLSNTLSCCIFSDQDRREMLRDGFVPHEN